MKINRPFVYLCTAMTLDGKISSSERVCTKVTVNDDRSFLYDNRVNCDAIMIGGKTLLFDDSGLVVKSEERQKQRLALGKEKEPTKIGIVSDVTGLNADGDFFNRGDAKKIVFTTERSPESEIAKLKDHCEVFVCGKEKVDLKKAMAKLKELGIESVMVEGGGELIFSLLKDDLVDEINLKIGDIILGGRTAPTLCDGEGFTGLTAKKVTLLELKQENNYMMLRYRVG